MKYSLLKRISAFVLAFALVMTTAFNAVGTTQANAAKKATVSAKGATVTVGASKNIKVSIKCKAKAKATIKVAFVKGATGKVTKKVTNSNAKKAAKTCKSTIKVTGKKAGKVKLSITPYINGKKAGKTKKITVTVKAAATTAAPATTTATTTTTEEATTGAVATTEAPSSSDASADSKLKSVALSNKSPKVGDVITAIVTPANASDISTYTWYEDAQEVSGNATNSYTVGANVVGKTIKVVVTTTAGEKYESDTSAAVVEDNSTKVEITDEMGFQSNGTALFGDTLNLTFGDGLGIPAQITWYVNGKLVATYNSTGGSLDQISLETGSTGGKKNVTGQCYAVVKNEAGQTFKSNVVEIVKAPVKAVLSDFKLLEDYTTPENITIDTNSKNYVVSITINKDYEGDFYLVDSAKTEITKATVVGAGATDCLKAAKATVTGAAIKTDAADMTAKTALTAPIKYVNAGTGAVTYMFNAETVGLDRGTKYNIVFDQEGIDADNLDATNHNSKLNITSTPVEAAYVKAPTKLVVTDVQTSVTEAGWNAQLYVGDEKASYLTNYDAAGTLANEFDNAKVELKSNGSSETKGGTTFATNFNGILGGKALHYAALTAGASNTKLDAEDEDDAVVTTGADQYVFAIFTGAKGIFGKDALELTSVATKTADPIVTAVKLTNPSDAPKDIKVAFTNLAAEANVYLVTKAYATSVEQTAEDAAKAFSADKKSSYLAVGSANAGAASITFKDVITKVTDATNGDTYTVVIVGKDGKHATFKAKAADPNIDDEKVTVKQVVSKFALKSQELTSGTTAVEVYDQYGNKMTSMAANITLKAKNATDASASNGTVGVSIDKDTFKITLSGAVFAGAASTNNTKKGDKWVFSLSETQNLVVTANEDEYDTDTQAAGANDFKVTSWIAEIK